jgi:hypothetical protein
MRIYRRKEYSIKLFERTGNLQKECQKLYILMISKINKLSDLLGDVRDMLIRVSVKR